MDHTRMYVSGSVLVTTPGIPYAPFAPARVRLPVEGYKSCTLK